MKKPIQILFLDMKDTKNSRSERQAPPIIPLGECVENEKWCGLDECCSGLECGEDSFCRRQKSMISSIHKIVEKKSYIWHIVSSCKN